MCANPIEKFRSQFVQILWRLFEDYNHDSPRSGFCAPAFSIIVDVHLAFSRLVGQQEVMP